MKKITILAVMLLAFTAVFAEENGDDSSNQNSSVSGYQPSTLFGEHQFSFGCFGGPIVQGTIMNGKVYAMGGGEGAVILNHQFIIGFSGKALGTPIMTAGNTGLYLGYGGLMLGYVFLPDQMLHPYIKTTIGAGGITEVSDPWSYYHNHNDNTNDFVRNAMPFFALDGEAGLELNVTRWMKVIAFAGYHYIYGPFDISGIKDTDLQGIDFGVKLQFGWF